MNLSPAERSELESMVRRQTTPAAQARRARLILLLDAGTSRDALMSQLACDSRFIATWKRRFVEDRLAGLYARHPGRAPARPPAKLEAQGQFAGDRFGSAGVGFDICQVRATRQH